MKLTTFINTALFVLGLCLVSPMLFESPRRATTLPTFGSAPSFQLIEPLPKAELAENSDDRSQSPGSSGSSVSQFSSDALKGQVWLAHFFFTSCQSVCPAITAEVSRIHHQFPNLQIVSITVDPENDTPSQLAAYARKFQADTAHWHFLASSGKTALPAILSGFKLSDGGEVQTHTTRLVLVDAQSQIRGYYLGTNAEDIQKLKRDLHSIL